MAISEDSKTRLWQASKTFLQRDNKKCKATQRRSSKSQNLYNIVIIIHHKD